MGLLLKTRNIMVLLRWYGSRRHTTRNIRFVKKIITPPDLPCDDAPPVLGQLRLEEGGSGTDDGNTQQGYGLSM